MGVRNTMQFSVVAKERYIYRIPHSAKFLLQLIFHPQNNRKGQVLILSTLP